MSVPSEHPHDELAVLALDALADGERAEVEDHVRRCPACAAELDDYRTTLSLVATEGPVPPAGTWDAIAERVAAGANGHGRAPIPGAALPSRPSARVAPDAPAAPAPAPAPTPVPPPAPSSGGDRPATRRRGRPAPGPRRLARLRPAAILAAAAAVVIVVGVAAGLRAGDEGPGDDVLAAAEAAMDSPGASVADLTTPEGQVVGQVVVDGDRSYAVNEGLEPLPAGRDYQLWALDGGGATSLGLLGDGSTEAVTLRPMGPGVASRLAISEEPDGGVDSPTGPIVATGTYA